MSRILKLIFLCLLFLNLNPQQGFSQSTEKSLEQLVFDLKSNPANDTLRKQVISKALSQTPPPVPEEAERRFFRGMAAMKNASSQTGFKNAASEFEQAIAAAPWYADAYYNAGVANNKAGNFAAAKKNFSFYLLAAPNAPDASEVKAMVYENEYLAEQEEKNQREQRQAKAEQARLERLVQPFRGAWITKHCLVSKRNELIHKCNEKEKEGSHWYGMLDNFTFEFSEKGVVIHSYSMQPNWGCEFFYGYPKEGNVFNTRWECVLKGGGRRTIWARTSSTYIIISPDRPLSDSAFNPKTR